MSFKNIFISFITLVLVGCSGGSPVPEGSNFEDTPDWVQNNGDYQINFGSDKEGIGALGYGRKGKMGTAAMRGRAQMDARNNLASQIKVRVRNIISQTRQELLEVGVAGAQDLGSVNTEDAIMQKVDQVLSGTRIIKQWKDPESGELIVWMIIDKESLSRLKETVLNGLLQEKLDSASIRHEDKIDQAFKDNVQGLGLQ